MSLNKVSLIGNLGRDPEERTTQAGNKVVSLNVATTEKWTDKSGQRQERTEWHRVVVFNEKIGELAVRYLAKGSQIYLEGQLQTRKYQDQQGIEKTVTEVVLGQYRGEMKFISGGKAKQDPPGTVYTAEPGGPVTRTAPDEQPEVLEEIPF